MALLFVLFLKKRIIPTLASIGLIKKRWIAPYPDTELARHSPDKLHVMWEVVAAPSHGAAKWDDVTSDSFNYTQLRRIGSQISKAKDGLAREAEEVKYESGELERDARQVAAWAGRPKGFTTHLERKHLNTRRANARDAKEVHRSELMAEHQAARQAAKEAVEV